MFSASKGIHRYIIFSIITFNIIELLELLYLDTIEMNFVTYST